MKTKLTLIFVSFLLLACDNNIKINQAFKNENLTSLVNPFIGTGGHGHTYPGATMPFGMMQLSPDTRLDGWDGCSGYHYSDEYIYGFSHTHLSGTGVSDYGDILLMPTNKVNFHNGADGKLGYRSRFTHKKETASPGFYQVFLEDTDIDVELTTSIRSGIHKYKFPTSDNQIIMLDLEHRDQVLDYKINQESNNVITGYRHSKAWATQQMLFYAMEFSHEIKTIIYNSKKSIAGIELNNPDNEVVFVKVAISPVDINGAKNNLQNELDGKTFSDVKNEADSFWEKQLEKIVIESSNYETKVNFYTSLYHTMIAPNLYQDIDGRYRGMDLDVHKSDDFEYYTVFSLWDTYRAAHPLYTLLEEERTNHFINTFLAKHNEGGIMPIWDLSACYTGCMIGYHAVSVIADAYLKDIKGYNAEEALEAMIHSATRDHLGLKSYKEFGYIPLEKESESVSKTLEYAYDDWTIAMMAKEMGKMEVYKDFLKRAQNYKNIFDPESLFMRGRFRNTWFAPFNPNEVNFNYTEANAWQYSFYVPQDITGFINILGGKEVLYKQLDKLFTAPQETTGRKQADITGLIGQYAHGNEPSHHMAYLYNYINKPHKTQERVSQILKEMYHNAPDGISGNEDCGQMSAWYVFSALGFYPVTPASNQYIIGTPIIDKATFHLENGNTFTINSTNLSDDNIYIQSVELNGEEYSKSYITHDDIRDGGSLVFHMTDKPSDWATKNRDIPSTEIKDHLIVPAPFIKDGKVAFKEKTIISLDCVDKDVEIFYAIDNKFKKYTQPIEIYEDTELQAYSKKGDGQSAIIKTQFIKINPNLKIKLGSKYANQYNGGGENALIDGILGTEDYRTGTWQGYWDVDLEATVDIGRSKKLESVLVNFLQDQESWIFYPTEVICYVSNDGENFKKAKSITIDALKREDSPSLKSISFDKNLGVSRYVKIVAKKLGALPEWHLGFPHQGRSWLFVDEIKVK